MNFEVFETEAELEARLEELEGRANLTIVSALGGGRFTLKWTEK